eukprot:symbB.v1.2.039161.t1/scaffold6334.1/size18957/2
MELPAPKGAGSKEVSGEADGVTLSQCLADGRVPVPDRMSFPKWQQWRKAEGRRPTKRKDGVGLSTAQEVALWRATMEELYGEDTAEAVDDSDDDEDDGGSSELRRVVAGPPAMPAALAQARSFYDEIPMEALPKTEHGVKRPIF